MSSFLTIDPGVTNVGWAYFEGRELRECGVSVSCAVTLSGKITSHVAFLGFKRALAQRIICEMMVVDGRRVPAQDLLDVNLVAGQLGRDEWVAPNEWKGGSISREVEQNRTWISLTPKEREVLKAVGPLTKTGKVHNAWSAVGIGVQYVLRRPLRAFMQRDLDELKELRQAGPKRSRK